MSETKWDWEMGGTELELSELIAGFVRALKPEVVVETGTYWGQTTHLIDAALQKNEKGHQWTIDNEPKVQPVRQAEMRRTTFLEGDSLEWAKSFDPPASIGLAFVDCGEEEHRKDVALALRGKMMWGGLLIAHDTVFAEGYMDMLKTALGPYSLHIPAVNGLTIWQLHTALESKA